jgi:hypothetical protein
MVQSQPRQIVWETLEKNHHKKGLVQWVKVLALSSNPSIANQKRNLFSRSFVCLWKDCSEMLSHNYKRQNLIFLFNSLNMSVYCIEAQSNS